MLTPGKGPGTIAEPQENSAQAQEPEPKTENPEYVTKEQFNQLLERIENQSKIIGSLKSKKAPEPEKPDTLTERIRALEEREARAKNNVARSVVSNAIISHGGNPDVARDQAQFLLTKLGGRLTITDEDQVLIEDNEKLVPATDYLKAFLQTEGRWMLPPKSPPNAKGSARDQAEPVLDVVDLSYSDYTKGKYDMKKMAAGKYKLLPPTS